MCFRYYKFILNTSKIYYIQLEINVKLWNIFPQIMYQQTRIFQEYKASIGQEKRYRAEEN